MPAFPRSWRARLSLLVGALLCADALVLIASGMGHLGVVLPLPVGLALMGLGGFGPQWRRWLSGASWRRPAWRAVCAGFGLWLISLGLFFVQIAQAGHAPPGQAAPDAILILGSGTTRCQPSPTLRHRLALGLALAQAHPQARVVVSGGVDRGFGCTEAEVMSRHLIAQGLPAPRLILEDASTSTHENLVFSRPLLAQAGLDPDHARILVVTSDFHVPRSLRIARQAGYRAVAGAGAPTPASVRWNAWLREYFAFASSRLLGEF
ncbi:MAG: hypothetical protein RLZZ592_2829 [Pseudomonadota bacterium]|jgi:uncharacterized SAM-binding protein YcdF (DUF218 family)|nr:hypothetical protein [Pseudomonadota bacterium]